MKIYLNIEEDSVKCILLSFYSFSYKICTYAWHLQDSLQIRFVFFCFFSKPNHLFRIVQIHVFWPTAFCMTNPSLSILHTNRICLQTTHKCFRLANFINLFYFSLNLSLFILTNKKNKLINVVLTSCSDHSIPLLVLLFTGFFGTHCSSRLGSGIKFTDTIGPVLVNRHCLP